MINIPLNDVPLGNDDSDNKEISKSGEIKNFTFKPKSHYEIGEKLNNGWHRLRCR